MHVNHSIPGATLSLLKTPEGNVVYGNDMKIDYSPVIEKTTDVESSRRQEKTELN